MASTSIGQEGLDFHPWCHRLVHWNLPGNPVDLEQREGRVHRYKGHAVRKNVAAKYADAAFEMWSPGKSLWGLMFARADEDARRNGESDLVPYWIAPGAVPRATASPDAAVHERGRSVRAVEAAARRVSRRVRAAAAGGADRAG